MTTSAELEKRLEERKAETARFTAFVNDPRSGAYPNERLAIRVAEKNLALAVEAIAALKAAEADAGRFQYLQNLPAKEAQAFFWNWSSRKDRAKAIDRDRLAPTAEGGQ